MAESVAEHLRRLGLAGRTVTVKVRFADFTTVTRSHTLAVGVDTAAGRSPRWRGRCSEAVDPAPASACSASACRGCTPGANRPRWRSTSVPSDPPAGAAAAVAVAAVVAVAVVVAKVAAPRERLLAGPGTAGLRVSSPAGAR